MDKDGYEQYRYDGSMDVKKRTRAIQEFKEPSEVKGPKIMIVSLKAGGVGLNVGFFMPPWVFIDVTCYAS